MVFQFSECVLSQSLTEGMDSEDLKVKAKELWDLIVKLETERYDLEERTRRQDYDVNIKIQQKYSI